MDITVKITDQGVKAALQKLSAKVKDMKPCMERIGQYYVKSVNENFDKQQSPDGVPWKKLAMGTYLAYANKRSDGKVVRKYLQAKSGKLSARGVRYLANKQILIESSDLRKSIKPQADSHSVTIGSDGGIPYAAVHQFGSRPESRHKIPARPYLAVNRGETMELADKDKTMILEIIDEYLAEI